jgi:hypothetical protein
LCGEYSAKVEQHEKLVATQGLNRDLEELDSDDEVGG